MKAIIMAAGKSTRTYPLTLTRPKPLLRVADKTIIEHQLDALTGIADTAVIVVGYRQEMIREALGDSYGPMAIEYVEQTEQLGTGHAILQCAKVIDGPFMAMNGDDLYDPEDLRRLSMEDNAALGKKIEDPSLYGVYDIDEAGTVVGVIEKPTKPYSRLANVGAYKFEADTFDLLEKVEKSVRGEIEVIDAIQALIDQRRFTTVEMNGYWLPISYPWHLLDANEYFLANRLKSENHGDVSPAAHLSGTVFIDRGAVILPGVVIDGPAYIGKNSKVGPNCWLRPYTTLGDGCRVGQGSETKNVVFLDGAAAPHQNYVGDSVLGAKVNLGCGTVVANLRHDNANVRSEVKGELIDTGRRKCGAFIGDHVHTGIHTSILPGRKMDPHTTTQPGEVVRRDKEGA